MQKSFGVAKVLTLVLGLSALATVPVHADTISYQNALVTLNVTSNNYVTVTITNTLSNSQVTSVGSNISGLAHRRGVHRLRGCAVFKLGTNDRYLRPLGLFAGHSEHRLGSQQLRLGLDPVRDLRFTGSEADCARDDDSGRQWLGFVCERKLFNQQQWPSQSLSRRNCFLHALRARRYGRLTI